MTPQAPNMLDLLAAPLNKSHVKTRTQAGREFFYIEGWHAIAEANRAASSQPAVAAPSLQNAAALLLARMPKVVPPKSRKE